jgi:hypothetical protein
MIVVLAAALGVAGFTVAFALALGRTAAIADREFDRMLAERRATSTIRGYRHHYAGFARSRSALAWEPSVGVPSSRASVGLQRLPTSSCTSRRPRVRSSSPGGGSRP